MEPTLYKNKCTGCRACYSVCPKGAIKMISDNSGFLYPEIDKNKCINCGLCKEVCSVENNTKFQTVLQAYAAMASDDIRLESSSGGAFTILAHKIIKQGGYVCGAAYNENLEVVHTIINKIDNLDKLRKSKYVQSDTMNCFKHIKTLLKNGDIVLFCGCPCQVEGLKLFLNNDYNNLVTIDLICHGVPSQKVFNKFLEETYGKKNIKEINFRDKNNGWNCLSTSVTTIDGYLNNDKDYFDGFINGLYMRECCYSCKYTNLNRVGDITLGDFWGISEKFNDNMGTSLILINSTKGETLLKICEKNFKLLKPYSISEILNTPNGIEGALNVPTNKSDFRNDFFENFEKKSFKDLIKKYTKNKYDICIINFHNCDNYGAILVGYAMQEAIKSLGYNPKHLNYIVEEARKKNIYINARKFAKKYLNLTNEYYSLKELTVLNNEADIFITGSDQIWRHGADVMFNNTSPNINNGLFLLSFINDDKKKIAYAVSFGERTIPEDFEYNNMVSYFINQIDCISVREKSGVNICKKYFNKDTTMQLDPVLLCGTKITNNLAQNAVLTLPSDKYIACYILDMNQNKKEIINYVEKILGIKTLNTGNEKDFKSVEDFVNIIKNSTFVITDSYHGNILAILYNRPYIAIRNISRGQDRFVSLADMLNLQNRLVNNIVDVKKMENNLFKIDWVRVNTIIDKEREKSFTWLKESIEKQKKYSFNENTKMMNLLWFKLIKEKSYNRRINTLLNLQNKIRKSYYWNKMLSFITYGKAKYYHTEKRKYYKNLLGEIKEYGTLKSLKYL